MFSFSEVTESYIFFALKSLWISKKDEWKDSFKHRFSGGTRVRTRQNPCNQKSKLKQKELEIEKLQLPQEKPGDVFCHEYKKKLNAASVNKSYFLI